MKQPKDKLLKTYKMYVYESGRVELVLQTSEIDLSNCSQSVRQLSHIMEYILNHPGKHIHCRVVEAVNDVAETERIHPSSVHSKITQKLGVSMRTFKNICQSYFDGESDDLEELLKNAIVQRKKYASADEAAINNLIERLRSSRNDPPAGTEV